MPLLTLAIAGALGALATALLQKYGCTAVVAASLVGLLGASVGYLLADEQLPLAVFAGAFVGMSAPQLLPLAVIGAAGAATGALLTLPLFVGYGGRLGATAFVAVVAAVALIQW